MRRKTSLIVILLLCTSVLTWAAVKYRMNALRAWKQSDESMRYLLIPSPVEWEILQEFPDAWDRIFNEKRPFIFTRSAEIFGFAKRYAKSFYSSRQGVFDRSRVWNLLHRSGDAEKLAFNLLQIGSSVSVDELEEEVVVPEDFMEALSRGFGGQAVDCSLVKREKAFHWAFADPSFLDDAESYWSKCGELSGTFALLKIWKATQNSETDNGLKSFRLAHPNLPAWLFDQDYSLPLPIEI